MQPDEHVYLSTGCLHGRHDHCRSSVAIDGGPKEPGQCKFCSARCTCLCHEVVKPVSEV